MGGLVCNDMCSAMTDWWCAHYSNRVLLLHPHDRPWQYFIPFPSLWNTLHVQACGNYHLTSHITPVMASNLCYPKENTCSRRRAALFHYFLHFFSFTYQFVFSSPCLSVQPRWEDLVAPESRYVYNILDQSSLVSGQRRFRQRGGK